MNMSEANNTSPSIRAATKADLEAITQIVSAAFPDDPGCDYMFPYRDQYPDEFKKWTRRQYEGYMEQPDKFVVLVATVPLIDAKDGMSNEAIALAVWDFATEKASTCGDGGTFERRDVHPVHKMVLRTGLDYVCAKYFAKYRKERLHLAMLLTHPDFRGRGAAKMLCEWGEEEAGKKGWTVTVTASPMGARFYKATGWKVVGEKEKIWVDVEDQVIGVDCFMKKRGM